MRREIRPIKWVGGKTQLLSKIIPLLPTEYNTYYEPFIGGCAVLFSIQPKKTVINDINPQLINLYSQIKNKDSVHPLIEQIKEYDSILCDKNYYLSLRARFNEKDVEWIRENYSEFRIIPIEAKRMVNRDGNKRNNGREVIIVNYNNYV